MVVSSGVGIGSLLFPGDDNNSTMSMWVSRVLISVSFDVGNLKSIFNDFFFLVKISQPLEVPAGQRGVCVRCGEDGFRAVTGLCGTDLFIVSQGLFTMAKSLQPPPS